MQWLKESKQLWETSHQTDVKNEGAVLNEDLVFLFQLNQKEDFVLYGQFSGKQYMEVTYLNREIEVFHLKRPVNDCFISFIIRVC